VISSDRVSPLPHSFNSIQINDNTSTTSEGIRRKLRSHTRQQHTGGDTSIHFQSPSPSPVTVLNENASQSSSNNSQTSDICAGEPITNNDTAVSLKISLNDNPKILNSELSNDSVMDFSDSTTTTNSGTIIGEQINTRKRRNRQQTSQQISIDENLGLTINSEMANNLNQSEVGGATFSISPSSNHTTPNSISTNNIELSSALLNHQVCNGENVLGEPTKELMVNCIKKFVDIRHQVKYQLF
jgi:hypothetical protein